MSSQVNILFQKPQWIHETMKGNKNASHVELPGIISYISAESL